MHGTNHPARSSLSQDTLSARVAAAGAAEDMAQGEGKAWNESVHLVALVARTHPQSHPALAMREPCPCPWCLSRHPSSTRLGGLR